MATFGDIPSGLGMPSGVGVRRNSANTGFEAFDTAPFMQSDVSRNFNEIFQPSTTDNMILTYSVDITAASTLLNAQSSTVFLEIGSDESPSSFGEMSRFTHGISGVVASSTTTGQLTCTINAGWFARLRTTGNATVTFRKGQEAILSVMI